jgi:hypothetical protein
MWPVVSTCKKTAYAELGVRTIGLWHMNCFLSTHRIIFRRYGMSQAAAAMMMNPSSVPQEPSVSASRTSRAGASAQSDATGVRSNSAGESTARPEPKHFKDVLEKRLPTDSQQNSVSSENSGEEKTEKKKTKASIQDFSNIALLSMNPTLAQTERKVSVQLSTQGGLSAVSPIKGSGQSVLPSAQVQGQSRIQNQTVAKESQSKNVSQIAQSSQFSSVANGKNAKDLAKMDMGVGGAQGQTKQSIQADRILANQKNQPSQTPESVSAIPIAGPGNPNLNPKINQERNSKIASPSYPGIKSKEGSQPRTDEIPAQQEGKTVKKTDKTKTPLHAPDSQIENNGQQQARADGIHSFAIAQNDAKHLNVASVRTDSGINAVSSTDSALMPQSPGKQVAQAIREQLAVPAPQSEIQMTLNPPELGKIRISFQQNNQEITGLLEVENLRTRADLQKELPQVLLSLQNAGVHIRRLDVVMQNPNNNPSPDQQPGNQAFSNQFMDRPDQYYASDSRQDSGRSGSERSVQDFQSTQTPDNADQRNSFIRDDAINVYL